MSQTTGHPLTIRAVVSIDSELLDTELTSNYRYRSISMLTHNRAIIVGDIVRFGSKEYRVADIVDENVHQRSLLVEDDGA